MSGEIITGEIVVGEIATGDIIRAEVIVGEPVTAGVPPVGPTAAQAAADIVDADIVDADIVDADIVDTVPVGRSTGADGRPYDHQSESRLADPEPARSRRPPAEPQTDQDTAYAVQTGTPETQSRPAEPHTGRNGTDPAEPQTAQTARAAESWTGDAADPEGDSGSGPVHSWEEPAGTGHGPAGRGEFAEGEGPAAEIGPREPAAHDADADADETEPAAHDADETAADEAVAHDADAAADDADVTEAAAEVITVDESGWMAESTDDDTRLQRGEPDAASAEQAAGVDADAAARIADAAVFADVRPDETDARPGETDTRPGETDTGPSETDTGPSETDTGPSETDTGPSETNARPSETNARPSETNARPSETVARPGEREATGEDAAANMTLVADTVPETAAPVAEPGPDEHATASAADEVGARGDAAKRPEPTPGAATPSGSGSGGAGEEHGLGWLLEMSGLGATETEPEPASSRPDLTAGDTTATTPPDASDPDDSTVEDTTVEDTAADEPAAGTAMDNPTGGPAVEEPAGADPVPGGPEPEDWFAPATDPRMAVPDEVLAARSAARTEANAEHDETATVPADIDNAVATADTAPGPTPAAKTAAGTNDAQSDEAAETTDSKATETTDGETAETTDGKAAETDGGEAGGAAGGRVAGGEMAGRQQRGEGAEPERRLVDPEQVLSTYEWRFDPETLRELVDDPERLRSVRDRLTDKVEYVERDAVRARLLSLRAVVSRILGDLGHALADGRAALGHAEATGELRRIAIAQARLAHVLQWRGEFAEADRLFAEADSVELPDRLRAEMYELAGRSAFDQGRYLEACNAFDAALDLRKGADPQMVTRVEVALDAVLAGVRATGWGPYPRSRDEILQRRRPMKPAYDERSGLWGYPGSVLPAFVDAQTFHEGTAWVRRPDVPVWELIGERGDLLVGARSGYLGVSPFAEGLAWVTREGAGGWFAIDQHNRVIIPGGFDDVRPFHRGVAPVRRGGWGAIDRHGRLVVQTKYRAFATTLTGGRRVDGFTDEGLAVIDAGDRLGVLDRSGQLIVAPVHAALVIHPVAFLIGDRYGRWGALDRNGEPLIDVVHAAEADVMQEIDRLLTDTRPVL